MRALLTLIAVIAMIAFVGIASAEVTLCPFDTPTPSTFPTGSFALSKTVAGTSNGIFIGSESTSYTDKLDDVVYHSNTIASGNTAYASELKVGLSTTSTKAIEQNGGTLSMGEAYYQGSRSFTNLTFCDAVTGGSSVDISNGGFVSNTNLNAPVDISYSVAMAGLNNDNALGFANVYMRGYSMEGSNSTLIAKQDVSQSSTWIGKFQFAVEDSLRITHPISSNYYTLAKGINTTC
jgi:hypothetical protein